MHRFEHRKSIGRLVSCLTYLSCIISSLSLKLYWPCKYQRNAQLIIKCELRRQPVIISRSLGQFQSHYVAQACIAMHSRLSSSPFSPYLVGDCG